jgi:hypothetical protein
MGGLEPRHDAAEDIIGSSGVHWSSIAAHPRRPGLGTNLGNVAETQR